MMRKFNLLALALVALFSFTCAAGERDADMPEYAGNPLTEEDFKRALTMFRDVVDDQESEASNGANLFEGDIVLPEGTSPEEAREVIKSDAKKWAKNEDGLVYLPYTIENTAWGQDVSCGRFEAWKCSACGDNEKACGYGTPYARWSDCMWQDGQCIDKPNPYARAAIARVVMEYAAKTCIRLVPYAEAYPENVDENGKVMKPGDAPVYPAPSIRFRPGSGYKSPLGMEPYTVNSITCGRWKWGNIAHEVMHTLGFFHEHTRLDRDQFINVHWENIKENKEQWALCRFVPALHAECKELTAEYDYGSIMHYSQSTIGWDGKPHENFTPLQSVPAGVTIGQRAQLSELDVKGIRDFYGCAEGSHDSSILLD